MSTFARLGAIALMAIVPTLAHAESDPGEARQLAFTTVSAKQPLVLGELALADITKKSHTLVAFADAAPAADDQAASSTPTEGKADAAQSGEAKAATDANGDKAPDKTAVKKQGKRHHKHAQRHHARRHGRHHGHKHHAHKHHAYGQHARHGDYHHQHDRHHHAHHGHHRQHHAADYARRGHHDRSRQFAYDSHRHHHHRFHHHGGPHHAHGPAHFGPHGPHEFARRHGPGEFARHGDYRAFAHHHAHGPHFGHHPRGDHRHPGANADGHRGAHTQGPDHPRPEQFGRHERGPQDRGPRDAAPHARHPAHGEPPHRELADRGPPAPPRPFAHPSAPGHDSPYARLLHRPGGEQPRGPHDARLAEMERKIDNLFRLVSELKKDGAKPSAP